MNNRLSIQQLKQILQEVEETSEHEIHIRKAREIYKKVNHDEFMSTLSKKGLKRWAKFDNNIDFADNGVEFLISFALSFKTEETNDLHPVLTSILNHLLEISHEKANIVRKRVCQVLLRLFKEIRDIIRQDALEKIVDSMKVLINDSIKTVRLNATKFMLNLYETEDVSGILRLHLESDPVKDVRILILRSIIPSEETFSMIVSRTKDVETEIRLLALTLLKKYDFKILPVVERLEILKCGLNDPTERIKEYFSTEILPTWLQQFGDNHFELISNFKTGNSKDEIIEFHSILKRTLKLFQETSLIKLAAEIQLAAAEPFSKCVPFNNLTIEKAVCWSALIEEAGKNTFSGSTESVMCDLTTFCQYIIQFIKFTEKDEETIENTSEEEIQFILLILFKMIRKLDYSDEYTKKFLVKFIEDILQNQLDYLTEEMIQILVVYARKLLPSDYFDEYFTNLIDDLRKLFQPDRLDGISSITAMIDNENQRLNIFTIEKQVLELNEELIKAIDSKKYEQLDVIWSELNFWYQSIAGILRQNNNEESEINKLIPDFSIANLVKYLYIASIALIQIPPSTSDIHLRKFFVEFIQPFFGSANLHTRGLAIKCGCALAMRNKNMASSIIETCYRQLITNENVQIWRIAVAALLDLSNLHNIHTSFHSGEKDVQLDGFLVELLGSNKQPELVKTLAKGVGFLILNGYIQNPLHIGKLLVHYFNPRTSTLLQQILHYLFVIMEKQEEKFDLLVRSLQSALELIANAPYESGMREIKIKNLVELVAFQTRNFPAQQKQIAVILLNLIEREIPMNLKRDLSKQLPSLRILVDENMRKKFIDTIDNISYDAVNSIKKNLLSFKENVMQNTYLTQVSSEAIERFISSSETTEQNRSSFRNYFHSTRNPYSLDVLETFDISENNINLSLNETARTCGGHTESSRSEYRTIRIEI